MTTVAVLWGPFEREELEAVGPDLLIAHAVLTLPAAGQRERED